MGEKVTGSVGGGVAGGDGEVWGGGMGLVREV